MKIQDLADELGLHMSTVSLALSGKGTISATTRQKVLTAARALGYQPNPLAQRLAASISGNLVCILSRPLDVGLGTQKLMLIQNELAARSLEVPLYTYAGPAQDQGTAEEESYAAQIRQLCKQRPRAIVCAGAVIHPMVFPELEAYQRAGGTVISYDVPAPLECDQVIFDREDNAYQAARCLLEQGHRKIGFTMSKPPAWSSEAKYMPWTSRLKGFRRALEEFGATCRDEWLIFHDSAYEEGGQDLARRFLAMPSAERPTGLCIVNDYVAMAFMVEAMRVGIRFPEEVSVVSHDNQRITTLCPVPLTSASHPVEKIAHTVVEMVTKRIAGYDGPACKEIITGDLVTRQSVVAPPA
jgi:LacI family transcriptional regulator